MGGARAAGSVHPNRSDPAARCAIRLAGCAAAALFALAAAQRMGRHCGDWKAVCFPRGPWNWNLSGTSCTRVRCSLARYSIARDQKILFGKISYQLFLLF